MIPLNDRAATEEHGFADFERQAYTIAVTAASFKNLIDGLYQHKERAVIRELATNAYDAHIAAGTEDTPFEIRLPSIVDATFWIRDYGISMSHDQIMRLYTSLFTSTKTDSNEQVGEKGVGSKSVFAKTDAFEVEAFKDGIKETYLNSIDTGGIPTISFLMSEETDEPDGFKVSFAVQARDYQVFARETADVMKAFKVKPKITGATITIAEADIEFENWMHYNTGSYPRYEIEQGCVRYPIEPTAEQKEIIQSGTIVIKVPIGSVATAMSREALQMNEKTQDLINEVFHELGASVSRYVSERLAGCVSYLDAVKSAAKTNGIFHAKVGLWHGRPIPLNGKVDLADDTDMKFFYATKHGHEVRELPAVTKLDVSQLNNITIYVDRGQKIQRRKMRLMELPWYNSTFLLKNPTNKDLRTLLRKWELRPGQIRSITTIPDVAVHRQKSMNRSGVYYVSDWGDFEKSDAVEWDELDEYFVIPLSKSVNGYLTLNKLGIGVTTRNCTLITSITKALDIPSPYLLLPQAFKHLDGGDHLWEDVVYEKLMAVKDDLLAEYREVELLVQFPTHIQAALVAAGEIAPKGATKGSPLLSNNIFPHNIHLFDAEVKDIKDEAAKITRKVYDEFPLLEVIESYNYSMRASVDPAAISQYIQLMKEAKV